MRSRASAAIVFSCCLASHGCGGWRNDAINATVIFTVPDPNRQLTDLALFSGGDKYAWPALRGGEVKTINLLPGLEDDRHLILAYSLNGQQKYWDGPKVEKGAGYRFEIKIDGAGVISERHCQLPCSLD
jgi:hypothetical protein